MRSTTRRLTWVLAWTAATLALPLSAQMRTEAACADAVDFAMRTAEHRDAGKSREQIAQDIHQSFVVFKQQYPDLEEDDMQQLLAQVFEQRWTRFVAARSTARACARQLRPSGPLTLRDDPAPLRSHS